MRRAGLLRAATGDLQSPVARLAHDSRVVAPDTCFIAIEGGQVDGHEFIEKAVEHGATSVVCERVPDSSPAGLRAVAHVTDSRAAMAEAAAAFFDRPSDKLGLIGVTGTNGKTTTAFLLHSALEALGRKAGLIGTIETRIGDDRRTATHTTPDAIDLNGMLADMVDAGCEACAMEVSSHALDQDRVRAITFAVGIFTNLTHEHLDYHGSLDAYRAAKARLFSGLEASATAVVNSDDPSWSHMVEASRAKVVTYGKTATRTGADSQEADEHVQYRVLENVIGGLKLELDGEIRQFRVVGGFNAANLAAAYAAIRALGFAKDETLDALAAAPPVPGRVETLRPEGSDGPIVVVDYAHTPDALENILMTVREMVPPNGALTVVFGCGGDRDRAKRPIMGRIATTLADRVILTNDNPRTEDPAAILKDVVRGGGSRRA